VKAKPEELHPPHGCSTGPFRGLLLNAGRLPQQCPSPRPVERLGRSRVVPRYLVGKGIVRLLTRLMSPRDVTGGAQKESAKPARPIDIHLLQQAAGTKALDEQVLGGVVHARRLRTAPPPGGEIGPSNRQVDAAEPVSGRRVSASRVVNQRPASGFGIGQARLYFRRRGAGGVSNSRIGSGVAAQVAE
jgi:hypothetical protein